ncbi:Xenobiotic-transporting_ATPase / Multidrug resistance-associated protein [Hexamita inflata]|uniref:Xenobiotic-transporting ATPase / Multidrug resistance-associated protein n=1 Tax=Hexamita inflata TaxID=28002 RepID=A0AA86NN85_9EUKA|nr:Xenobiotic-transporting ATPase / Multidrug resistance-associated protein [Hexamita inflata]CAI9959921.1 Xenobiotic-transporting ATPase / Multidrug resistance-associated protein [Hexamita inflata]
MYQKLLIAQSNKYIIIRSDFIRLKIHELDPNQRDKLPQEVLNEEVVLKVTGKPSFTWNLASDKVVPPVMDPFFKDNERTTNFINKKFPLELKKYELELAKYNKSHQIQPAVETQVNVNQLTAEESEQLTVALTKESKDMVLVDKWCLAFDVPFVSRLQSLEQYNFTNYVPERKHTELDRLKLQAIHLQTMRFYMNKNNNADLVDGPAVVKNLDIEIKKGDIIGVCGQVGQGKTSFFNAILGEMRLTDSSRTKLGTYMSKDGIKPIYNDYDLEKVHQEDPRFDSEIPHIYVNGTIAYFSQACHIFSKSARQNILFNKPYDAEKYKRVVEMCCLKDDFAILAAGDQTEVGGKGVTLSGGQKARLSLARAIYSDASIYLLDDPLSAVDAHVGKTIWNDAILGYLKSRGATVIIASHQTQYFNDCDKIIQITDGEIVNYDTVQNLMKDNVKIIGITGETSTQQTQTATQVINESVTKVTEKDSNEDKKTQKSEQLSASGNVKLTVYKKWVTSGSIALCLMTLFLLIVQTGINQYQTIMVSHWSSDKGQTTKLFAVLFTTTKRRVDISHKSQTTPLYEGDFIEEWLNWNALIYIYKYSSTLNLESYDKLFMKSLCKPERWQYIYCSVDNYILITICIIYKSYLILFYSQLKAQLSFKSHLSNRQSSTVLVNIVTQEMKKYERELDKIYNISNIMNTLQY